MITGDFNGDNWPDVLVTGNDNTYDVSSGGYDASKGIVLMNTGRKPEGDEPPFKILEPPRSGFLYRAWMSRCSGLKETLRC